jgi:hypothetical protein
VSGWCPQCGPINVVDEDGCCVTCGCDALGEGATTALLALEDSKRLGQVIAAVNDLVFRLRHAIRFIHIPKEHMNATAWRQRALKLLDGRSGPKWWNGDTSR